MTILLVQTFLLLLGAFLLGASLACVVRRTIAGRADPAVLPSSLVAATAAGPVIAPEDTDRFGRALAGDGGVAPTGPVVEVQPRPPVRVTPLIEPVAHPAPEPEPAAVEPAPPPPAPEAEPPASDEAISEPSAVEPAPAPDPVSVAEPEPSQSDEVSYTQVAAAMAAGTAAAAAAREREGEPEQEVPPADDTSVEVSGVQDSGVQESGADAPPAPDDEGRSYTEIAAGAAGLVAAAAAVGEDDEERASDAEAASEPEPVAAEDASQFGGPEGDTVVAAAAAEGTGDDFTRIHTIDAALRDRLHSFGMMRFADIGGWSASDVIRFSQSLGVEPGRIEQENWVGQAQVLAASGVTDYPRGRGSETEPSAAPPADGERLNRIIGIDPDSEGVLRANGVTRLAEIAAWTDEDVSRFEEILGTPGRIERENWVEQARFLTRGSDVADAIENIGEDIGAAAAAAGAAAAAAVVAAVAASEEETPSAEPEPEASAPEDAGQPEAVAEAGDPAETSPTSESDEPPAASARGEGYTGLRSVRSEALVGGAGFALPPTGEVDDLKRIRGIGVLIEKKLNSLGITSYEQVANWTGEDVDRMSQTLDFKGRIERENWIEQARILASGGQTEFSRRVDKGEA